MVSKITGPVDPALPSGDSAPRVNDRQREKSGHKKEDSAPPPEEPVTTDFSLAAIEALLQAQGAAEGQVAADIALLHERGVTHLALAADEDILAAIAHAAAKFR